MTNHPIIDTLRSCVEKQLAIALATQATKGHSDNVLKDLSILLKSWCDDEEFLKETIREGEELASDAHSLRSRISELVPKDNGIYTNKETNQQPIQDEQSMLEQISQLLQICESSFSPYGRVSISLFEISQSTTSPCLLKIASGNNISYLDLVQLIDKDTDITLNTNLIEIPHYLCRSMSSIKFTESLESLRQYKYIRRVPDIITVEHINLFTPGQFLSVEFEFGSLMCSSENRVLIMKKEKTADKQEPVTLAESTPESIPTQNDEVSNDIADHLDKSFTSENDVSNLNRIEPERDTRKFVLFCDTVCSSEGPFYLQELNSFFISNIERYAIGIQKLLLDSDRKSFEHLTLLDRNVEKEKEKEKETHVSYTPDSDSFESLRECLSGNWNNLKELITRNVCMLSKKEFLLLFTFLNFVLGIEFLEIVEDYAEHVKIDLSEKMTNVKISGVTMSHLIISSELVRILNCPSTFITLNNLVIKGVNYDDSSLLRVREFLNVLSEFRRLKRMGEESKEIDGNQGSEHILDLTILHLLCDLCNVYFGNDESVISDPDNGRDPEGGIED